MITRQQPVKKSSLSTRTIDNQENERLFPRNETVEYAIIALIVNWRVFYDISCKLISSDMFYDERNKLIYETCCELYMEKNDIDALLVYDKLIKNRKLKEIRSITYLTDIMAKYTSYVDIYSYCYILKDKYLHRKMIETLSKATDSSFNEYEDAEEILSELNNNIENLTETTVKEDKTIDISKAIRKSFDNMHNEIADKMNGKPPGIPTGFADLNNLTNGWKQNQLIILASRPGVGKSSIAVKFAKKAAESNFHVLFFSLEMDVSEITDKLILMNSKINSKSYNSRNMTLQEIENAEKYGRSISKLPITINDTAKMTVNDIMTKSKMLKKQDKCDIVFIDYLQLITPISKKDRTRENEVSEISRNLKIMAKDLQVPVVVLCQMNRNIESYHREPMLSDLRESGAIEQDADMVIFINRPGANKDEVTDKDGNVLENYMELLIKKNRSGKTGKIKLFHNDYFTDFYDWDRREQSRQASQPTQKAFINFYEPQEQELPF